MQTTIWKYSREIIAELNSEEAALEYVVRLHPRKTVTSRKPPFDPGLLVYVDEEYTYYIGPTHIQTGNHTVRDVISGKIVSSNDAIAAKHPGATIRTEKIGDCVKVYIDETYTYFVQGG